jgi:tetratricopeptide (TPR) repeat protein
MTTILVQKSSDQIAAPQAETAFKTPSQNSYLLSAVPDVISNIASYLFAHPGSCTSLVITSTEALTYKPNIERRIIHELRGEARRLFSFAREKKFNTPIKAFEQDVLNAIDSLTLQNAEQTKDRIKILLLRFLGSLSPEEVEQLQNGLKTTISLDHLESCFQDILETNRKFREFQQLLLLLPVAGVFQIMDVIIAKLGEIAFTLCSQGRFVEAIEIANSIESNDLLGFISREICKQRNLPEAIKVVNMIYDDQERGRALMFLAYILCRRGRVFEAIEITDMVSREQESSNNALLYICKNLCKWGLLRYALKIADMLPNDKPERGHALIYFAKDCCQRLLQGDSHNDLDNLQVIVKKLCTLDRFPEAIEAANMLNQNDLNRGLVLITISDELCKRGRFQEALQIIGMIPSKGQRDTALQNIPSAMQESSSWIISAITGIRSRLFNMCN